ncbi:MAG: hypothetical protein PUP92_26280 [Rhizonema sp. PD38]|nr:hypothetical protein [Rhizonema sp. PD38]
MMFSPDNWYVIGDAACIFDAFYSMGSSITAFAIESVTEIIRAKLVGEADAEAKRSAYNDFNLIQTQGINQLMSNHAKQLGNASVMIWRIYFEYMLWFGIVVPLYVGKWHLNLTFIKSFMKIYNDTVNGLFVDVYKQFNQLADRGANIGFMDCYRADQLLGDYNPLMHFDHFLENAKFEPWMCNIFAGLKYTHFYFAIWYLKLQWKGFGFPGLLAPRHLYHFFRLLALSGYTAIGDLFYRHKIKGVPTNSQVAKMRQDFTSYRHRSELQPWTEGVTNLPAQSAHQQLNDQELSRVKELSVLG